MSEIKIDRERLTACRKKFGLTKQETARRINVSQPAYLRYESGERTPSIHVVRAMAEVLDTSAAYLTGETSNPYPDSYTVRETTDPELFGLVKHYKNSDADAQDRMKKYLEKILESEKDG